MTFRVGQNVVYVRDLEGFWNRVRRFFHPYVGDNIVLGRVYEVSAVLDDGEAISLVGVYSPECGYWAEGWKSECFEPVVDRKTDISIFKKMFNPAREDA